MFLWNWIVSSRLWSLIVKETREMLRDNYLLFLIIVPPILQLLIIGGALDPSVHSLSLAVVDHSNTTESREFVARFGASGVFHKSSAVRNETTLSEELEKGKYNVGLVIPKEFSRELNRGERASIQVLVDGADAYTAGIASGYLLRTINGYRPQDGIEPKESIYSLSSKTSLKTARTTSDTNSVGKQKNGDNEISGDTQLINPRIQILYNPEQRSSWSFIPGILGACLTLTGTLVSSATVLRERERGTMEQLLMTPASSLEILLAKMIPIVVIILGDVCLAVYASHLIFGMPLRGSLAVLLLASALYAFVGIGLGILLGSLCQSQRQAQLASFFINIPVILLSGTVVPLDSMPAFFQMVSAIDPLRYYTLIAKGVILKGETLEMVSEAMLWLALSAAVVLTMSAHRFRRQLQ